MIEFVKPMDIEKRSFEIITELLGDTPMDPENAPVIKRVIHTSADFDYAKNLVFSPGAVEQGIRALKAGCDIVTDTQMAKAGINKTALGKLGGAVHCFMSDEDVAREAKLRGCRLHGAGSGPGAALYFCHRQRPYSPDLHQGTDGQWEAEPGSHHRRAGGLCERGGEQGADPGHPGSPHCGPGPEGWQQCGGGHLQRPALSDLPVIWKRML